MLIGALGCNLAWGIIDGVLYLMGCLAERGRNLKTLKAVRQAADPQQAQRLLADALPRLISRPFFSRRNWRRCANGCCNCRNRRTGRD